MLALADVAAEQWGLLTTAQARAVGASTQDVARLANQGALERLSHGVYRIAGAPASPLDSLRGAWLSLDPARRSTERWHDQPPAIVSHSSAARLNRLGDLASDTSEFTTPTRKQTRSPDIRIHRRTATSNEWTIVDGLPVTTILRTIDDLAGDRVDGGHLAGIIQDALTRHQIDPHALADTLTRHAHHYGAPKGDGNALLQHFQRQTDIPSSGQTTTQPSAAGTTLPETVASA